MKSLIAALALALAPVSSIHAAEFEAAIGKTGYGRCHMLSCGFFVIDDAVPLGTGKDGTLFAVSIRYWADEYQDRPYGDPYSAPPKTRGKPEKSSLTFIYCSKTRPTIFAYSGGAWVSALLRIGKSAAIAGATADAHNIYYAACHQFITKDAVSRETAIKLGYAFPQEKSDATDEEGNVDPLSMVK